MSVLALLALVADRLDEQPAIPNRASYCADCGEPLGGGDGLDLCGDCLDSLDDGGPDDFSDLGPLDEDDSDPDGPGAIDSARIPWADFDGIPGDD